MRKFTEIVFIIDRSGSMYGLEKDTTGGFNSMLAAQKMRRGRAPVAGDVQRPQYGKGGQGGYILRAPAVGKGLSAGMKHRPAGRGGRSNRAYCVGTGKRRKLGKSGENHICHHHRRPGKFQPFLQL